MAGKRNIFRASTCVSGTLQSVWDFHIKPAALEALSPTEMKVYVSDKSFTVGEGKALLIWMSPKGKFIRLPWVSKFVDVHEPFKFTDIQTIGPFAYWRHTHSFESSGDETIIHDQIEYAVPGWLLGDMIIGKMVDKQLQETFRYRSTQLMSHPWSDNNEK